MIIYPVLRTVLHERPLTFMRRCAYFKSLAHGKAWVRTTDSMTVREKVASGVDGKKVINYRVSSKNKN